MRVRCIKLLDSLGRPTSSSPWAKLGAVYEVLDILVESGRVSLRLVGDESTPAMFQVEMFEVVDSTIPPTWTVTSAQPGCLYFAPTAWSRPGFWEDFFDGNEKARACFEAERKRIIDAHMISAS